MTSKLIKVAQIETALRTDGATLVCDEATIGRFNGGRWFVRHADGRRVECTKVADRLTWGGPRAKVQFVGREGAAQRLRVYELK